jgi:hypothetical protein
MMHENKGKEINGYKGASSLMCRFIVESIVVFFLHKYIGEGPHCVIFHFIKYRICTKCLLLKSLQSVKPNLHTLLKTVFNPMSYHAN